MKKMYAYASEIQTDVIIPEKALLMAYEEHDGEAAISMHFKDNPPHIIVISNEPYIWEQLREKLNNLPEYYRSFAMCLRQKLIVEHLNDINFFTPKYKPLIKETDKSHNDEWTRTQIQGVMQQYNLLDMSELVEDRIHFEEALALLNNIGKRYRLQIYINGPDWHTVIGNNDSPYPSFSIALHVFLTKMEYYMTRNTRDPEYK